MIRKVHELSVLLTAMCGYIAIALTGQFDASAVLLSAAGALLAFYLRPRALRLPSWVWNVSSLLVLIAVGIVAMRSLLNAAVYFFICLQIFKLLTLKTRRDALWVYLVALFQVIGAAALTTSFIFGPIIIIFVFTICASFVLFSVRREQEVSAELAAAGRISWSGSPSVPPDPTDEEVDARAFTRGVVGHAVYLTAFVTVVSALFFLVIPRFSAHSLLTPYNPGMEGAASGFDEMIEFGLMGDIQLDDQVAMYVRPIGHATDHVRMRGVAVDTFDGRTWRRTTTTMPDQPFLPFAQRQFTARRYQVIQPANITNYLFGPSFPEKLSMPQARGFYFDPLSNAAWLPSMVSKEFTYEVASRIEHELPRIDPTSLTSATRNLARLEAAGATLRQQTARRQEQRARPDAAALSRAGLTDGMMGSPEDRRQQRFEWLGFPPTYADSRLSGATGAEAEALLRSVPRGEGDERVRLVLLPPNYREKCLAVPPSVSLERLSRLAEDWTAGARSDYERTIAIETRLSTEYEYSLTNDIGQRFIERFLFETRAGHCEYFATSMVLLCRSVGIPARVVNGYVSREWNRLAGSFTVRNSDAHSWVEVFFDGYGWMTFDPTPPAAVGRDRTLSALSLLLQRTRDAVKVLWYRHVIDYSFDDQRSIARGFATLRAALLGSAPDVPGLGDNDQGGEWLGRAEGILALVSAGFFLVMVYVVWRIRRWAPGSAQHRCGGALPEVSRLYGDILRQLARRGWVCPAGATPAEFAATVPEAGKLGDFPHLTRVYYEARYGTRELSRNDAAQFREFRNRVRRLPRSVRASTRKPAHGAADTSVPAPAK